MSPKSSSQLLTAVATACVLTGCDQVSQEEYSVLAAQKRDLDTKVHTTRSMRLREIDVMDNDLKRHSGVLRQVDEAAAELATLQLEFEQLESEVSAAEAEFSDYKSTHPLPAY